MSYHVAILANLKQNAPFLDDVPGDQWDDLDSAHTIDGLCAALQASGHRVTFLEADRTLPFTLRDAGPDICFNLAEGHYGDSREAQVPALLELLRIPYTGSKILTHALSLDKAMTKRIWMSHGLTTAPFQVFTTGAEALDPCLTFPLFVKPLSEGTGIGITRDALVHGEAELRERLDTIIEAYHQPALVERYLSGRELTVGVIGNGAEQVVLPAVQIDVAQVAPGEGGLYTNHVKTDIDETYFLYIPTDLSDAEQHKVRKLARDGFAAIGALDVSRLDIRYDDAGEPHLLEINTLPGMTSGFSDLCLCVDRAGLDYAWLVNSILNSALTRYGMPAPALHAPQRLLASAL